jgi:hypothetical protein
VGTFMLDEDLTTWLNFLEIFSEIYPDTYNTPERALEGYNETMQHYNNILILLRKGKGT